MDFHHTNQPNQPWFGAHSPVVWDPTPGLDVAHRFQVEGLGCREDSLGTLPMRASFREGKMKQIGSKIWNKHHMENMKKNDGHLLRMQLVGCNQRSNNRATLDNIYIYNAS